MLTITILFILWLVLSGLFFWTFRGEFGGHMAMETSALMSAFLIGSAFLVVKAIL